MPLAKKDTGLPPQNKAIIKQLESESNNIRPNDEGLGCLSNLDLDKCTGIKPPLSFTLLYTGMCPMVATRLVLVHMAALLRGLPCVGSSMHLLVPCCPNVQCTATVLPNAWMAHDKQSVLAPGRLLELSSKRKVQSGPWLGPGVTCIHLDLQSNP